MTHSEKVAFWSAVDWTLRDSDIAIQTNRQSASVKYWRNMLDKPDQPMLVPRERDVARAATMRKLRALGLTNEAIGQRFGVSRQRVDQIVNRHKQYARAAARCLGDKEACQICNRPGPLSRHHSDYAKPLSVIWLCKVCHAAADALRHESQAQQKAA